MDLQHNPQYLELLKTVSRETYEKLELYVSLLTRWNGKINLISDHDMKQIWDRHIADSIQLMEYLDTTVESILDLGSGGGFPGLVLAIATNIPVTLIESDVRKTVFLREVLRETKTQATVIGQRIENVKDVSADVITARALAPLEKLLYFAKPKLKNKGYCLFLKGRRVYSEIEEAKRHWHIDYEATPSKTSPDGMILKINQFENV